MIKQIKTFMTTGSNVDLDNAVNDFLKTLNHENVRDIQYRESPGSMNNMASSSVMVVYLVEDS